MGYGKFQATPLALPLAPGSATLSIKAENYAQVLMDLNTSEAKRKQGVMGSFKEVFECIYINRMNVIFLL